MAEPNNLRSPYYDDGTRERRLYRDNNYNISHASFRAQAVVVDGYCRLLLMMLLHLIGFCGWCCSSSWRIRMLEGVSVLRMREQTRN